MERLFTAFIWTCVTGAFQLAATLCAILIYAAGGTGDQMIGGHLIAFAASQAVWIWLNR